MENIGNMLKQKRLERGLTIEQISEKTRLTTKHIKALEEGEISFFKDDLSYLRFFVKSYCEAVGLDFEDIKDELRQSVENYTMSFTNTLAMQHEEMEKHISETELSKVASAGASKTSKPKVHKPKQKRTGRLAKPDFSLVSLIAVVGVIVVVLALALVFYLNSDKAKSADAATPSPAPVQGENGENNYPTTEEDTKQQEETPKKELKITKNDTTHYTITGYTEGDELSFATQFIGSNSGYSVTVDGTVLSDPKAQVYNSPDTATAKIKAKKGTKVQLYIGYLLNTSIKINDSTVTLDSSIANAGGSITLEFTFGE